MCACWQASAFEMFVENNALGSLGRFSLSPSAVTFSSQSVIVIPSIGCRAILGVKEAVLNVMSKMYYRFVILIMVQIYICTQFYLPL